MGIRLCVARLESINATWESINIDDLHMAIPNPKGDSPYSCYSDRKNNIIF